MNNMLAELDTIYQSIGSFNPFSGAVRKSMSFEDDNFIRGLLARNHQRYQLQLAKDLLTALSSAEIQQLIHGAVVAYIAQDDYYDEDILRDLAILRPEAFKNHYQALIDAGICDIDGIIYSAANETISTRLLTMIHEADFANFSAHQLLSALAWIGDDAVINQWDIWRQDNYRPEGVYLDPYQYALIAGWELDDHQRRSVCFPAAYELIPSRDVLGEAIEGPIATTLHADSSCQWCHGPLTVLFDLDLRDPRITRIFDLDGEELRILCCDSCTPMGMTPIFFEFDLHGMARWSEHNASQQRERESFAFPERSLVLGMHIPQSRELYRKRISQTVGSHIGGTPLWVQDFSYHPVCFQCSKHMHFIGQADVADIADGEGAFYGFACFACHISTCVYQQT